MSRTKIAFLSIGVITALGSIVFIYTVIEDRFIPDTGETPQTPIPPISCGPNQVLINGQCKDKEPPPLPPSTPSPTPTLTPAPTPTPAPTKDGNPIAKISGPTWARPFQVVEFSAEESIDIDGVIMRYQWSFGDGTPATKKIVKHRFDSETIYKVSLTVWDDENKNNSTTHEIQISHANPITKLPDLSIPQDFKTFDKEDNYVINAGEEFSISGIIKNNNFLEVADDICIKLEFEQFGRSQSKEICGYKIFNKPQIRFQFNLIIGFEGTYLLTFTIDPDNLIEETKEDNNITEYILNIQ